MLWALLLPLLCARVASAQLSAEETFLASHPRSSWPRVFDGRRGKWTGLEVFAGGRLTFAEAGPEVLYVVDEAATGDATRLARTVVEAAAKLDDESIDVIYFQKLTDYSPLKEAVLLLWPKLKRGGVIAGSSFCDFGDVYERSLRSTVVPRCGNSTLTRRRNMRGTVRAVLEAHKLLGGGVLQHSKEDAVETPSWFFVKPTALRARQVLSVADEPSPRSCGAVIRQPPAGITANPRCPRRHAESRPIDPMGADLTIAYLYYRDVDYMRKHAETWSKPNYFTAEVKRRVVFLVIDDGSPEPDDAATLFNSMACSSVRTVVVRVTEDIAWNIGGARNLIFTVAPTELVFSVDADQILPPDLVEWALLGRKYRATLDNCNIVRGFPRKLQNGRKFRVHPGVMLASKSSYWRVGGCEEADALFLDTLFEELLGAAGSPHFITAASGDEDFVGAYGHTDVHFNFRVTYNTRGCNIVAADSAPPMICIDDPLKKTNFFKRETDHNKAIFHAKTSKQKPWSTDYLRFSWAVTYDSALRNPCS